MLKCPICKKKYEPKHSEIEPCPQYSCRVIMYEKANKKLKQKAEKEKKIAKKQMKESLLTKSDYEKLLQTEINTICRLIDKGHLCISSDRELGKKHDAGHFRSRKSAPSIRFNLLNIWAQSVEQNKHKSGNTLGYIENIKRLYGIEIVEEIINLKDKYSNLILSIDKIKEATIIARNIVKELKSADLFYSLPERLSLRRELNTRIGIYQ